jgi:hypothetical protein
VGEPVSLPDPGAPGLAAQDPYQCQWWALGLVGALPVEQKKGYPRRGIYGHIDFQDEADSRAARSKTAHERTALKRQIEAMDRQIDNLVYDLYGLTEKEIAIVEAATP